MTLAKDILSRYFKAQKTLIEIKQMDNRNVILSLPLHYSGYTRVEFAITQITEDDFVISDLAQTLGELRDSGYGVSDSLRLRIIEMTKLSRITLSGDNLVRTCSGSELGQAMHEFAEATKTIGDAYLAYPSRVSQKDTDKEEGFKQRIRKTLDSKELHYKERHTIPGEIESHKVDFYVHPNGQPGLAVAILPNPDHIHAEAWGFKAQDIKRRNQRVVTGVVYDAGLAKQPSRAILDRMFELPIPSTELDSFGQRLEALGVFARPKNGKPPKAKK